MLVVRDQCLNPVKAEFYFENDICCVTHNIMSRLEIHQKLTQLSPGSHPRHVHKYVVYLMYH